MTDNKWLQKKDEEIKPWCLPTTLYWHKQDPLEQCFHVRNNRLSATADSLSFTCNANVQPGSAWGVNVPGNQLKSSQHNHFLAMQPIIKICGCFCYSFVRPLSLIFLPHTPINWQKINWQPIWQYITIIICLGKKYCLNGVKIVTCLLVGVCFDLFLWVLGCCSQKMISGDSCW